MPEIENVGVFFAAAILLVVTPGADTAYILGRSMGQGRWAGIAAALGVSTGGLFHTAAAALGFSALLLTTEWAFSAIKLLGAAYLIFQGVHYLRHHTSITGVSPQNVQSSPSRVFRQGFVTNILNPKVAMFFLAFLPQFTPAGASEPAYSFFILGLAFNVMGAVWCVGIATLANAVSSRLRENSTIESVLNRSIGALFVLLGLRLVVLE